MAKSCGSKSKTCLMEDSQPQVFSLKNVRFFVIFIANTKVQHTLTIYPFLKIPIFLKLISILLFFLEKNHVHRQKIQIPPKMAYRCHYYHCTYCPCLLFF
ncbi:hypothetical protein [Moraxella lacunata]|uniref:hypothetical protein n=1 Tax=Moraxella lacunata TaxID=477 RepID=UPI003EE17043